MNTFPIDRDAIIRTLHDAAAALPAIRAAWLGGSDASNRLDEFSDIDLVVIVEDDAVEETFTHLQDALVALAPIELMMRLPDPTWHGHAQAIYRLEDSNPAHLIDLVVMRKRDDGNRFLEPERHGDPHVLFDHDMLVTIAPPLDGAAHADRLGARRAELPVRFELFQTLVERAIEREHIAEAVERFTAFTIKPLVELLRMTHCPNRFDFGLRYLDRDLPRPVRERVDALMLNGSLDDLRAHHADAVAWFRDVIDAEA